MTTQFPIVEVNQGGEVRISEAEHQQGGESVIRDSASAPTVALSSLSDRAFLAQDIGTVVLHDRAAEAEAVRRQQEFEERFRNPALAAAKSRVARRRAEVQHWDSQGRMLDAEVARLANLVAVGSMSEQSFDSEPGSRTERLAAARTALEEATAELQAAKEELVIAESELAAARGNA